MSICSFGVTWLPEADTAPPETEGAEPLEAAMFEGLERGSIPNFELMLN